MVVTCIQAALAISQVAVVAQGVCHLAVRLLHLDSFTALQSAQVVAADQMAHPLSLQVRLPAAVAQAGLAGMEIQADLAAEVQESIFPMAVAA